MRSTLAKLAAVVAVLSLVAVLTAGLPAATPQAAQPAVVAAAAPFQSIGPLTFGPDGVLFAADREAAAIYALELGSAASGGAPGTKAIDGIDQQIASMLGTDVREIAITDLAVHPKTRNAFISLMRGQGASAKPVLLRVDGAGKIELVDVAKLKSSRVTLPNPPQATTGARNPRRDSITDMAYQDGRLYVAGLSNEEFASKLRSVGYPFSAVDEGVSVEIFHGAHGQFETRSPVYTFVPYKVGNESSLIAGYLCTPLVKFPLSSLKPGGKVMGTTIAELGNGNRPLDMVLFRKDGKDFLLMSNTSRGVMKIPTDRFATEPGIKTPVKDKAGVPYETIQTMKDVEQLDLLNDTQSIVLARSAAGALNLQAVALP
jgi:hypothetical protein